MLLVFTSLACNLSGNTNQETNEELEERLKTSVAATIAVANHVDLPSQDPEAPAATQEPAGENTAEPLASTATSEPTAAPTSTPTETSEPTPTSSPTPPPDDPALTLGEPTFLDTFDSTANFTVYDEASTTTEIKEGKFFFTKHEIDFYGDEWTFSWKEIEEFYLEVTTITPASCSGKDRFGLIFRSPIYSKGYLFLVACDGSYILNRFDGSDMESLIEWTFDPAINTGPNQVNRLGVKTFDNDMSLYVNGNFLVLVEDNMFTGKGFFGFVIAAADTPEFTVAFDNLRYWD
jgi:hypothetical protein